jgi:hypothetical protein
MVLMVMVLHAETSETGDVRTWSPLRMVTDIEAPGFRSYVLRDVDHRGIMGSGQRSDLESFTLSGQWGCRNGWG